MAMPTLESLKVDDSTNDTIQAFGPDRSPYPAVRSLNSVSRFLRDKRDVTSATTPSSRGMAFRNADPPVVNGVVASLIRDCSHASANRYAPASDDYRQCCLE
jgi:hypothetical protein